MGGWIDRWMDGWWIIGRWMGGSMDEWVGG